MKLPGSGQVEEGKSASEVPKSVEVAGFPAPADDWGDPNGVTEE